MSTPTRRPAKAAQPAARPPAEHNDWAASPVTYAIIGCLWALFLPLVFRVTNQWVPVQPWITLLPHVALAVVAVLAGWHRKPRALSPIAMIYRMSAIIASGMWVFWSTADTSDGTTGRVLVAGVGQLALIAAAPVVAYYALRKHSRVILAVGGGVFVAGQIAVVTAAGGVFAAADFILWLHHAATVTAPINRHALAVWLWPGGLLTLFTGAATLAWLGVIVGNRELEQDRDLNIKVMTSANSREKNAMRGLLVELTSQPNIHCTDFQMWDNRAGETYEIDLSMTTLPGWRALVSHADTIASRMRLPDGCGVETMKSPKGRHYALLKVSRKNVLRQRHVYPHTLEVGNIYEGRLIGVDRPGDPVLIKLRENSMIVIGQRRSGKTTFLRSLITSMLWTNDTLIWTIDLMGGGLPQPFLEAFADGKVKRCAIDWAAEGAEEALLMAETARDIAIGRKKYYKWRKKADGITLMPVDAQVPQIFIILDEGAEVMGKGASDDAREVCAVLEELQRTAGDSGVNIVYSVLRAISTALSTDVLAGCAARVSMRVSNREELAYLFGDYAHSQEDATEQGSGHVQIGHGEPVRVFKGLDQAPADMERASIATVGHRPYLDEYSREIAGRRYADRWWRNREMLRDEYGELKVEESVLRNPDAGAPAGQGRPPARAGAAAGQQPPAVEGAVGGGVAVAERPAAPPPGRPRKVKADDQLAANEELLRRYASPPPPPAGIPGPPGPPPAASEEDEAAMRDRFNAIVAAEWTDGDGEAGDPAGEDGGGEESQDSYEAGRNAADKVRLLLLNAEGPMRFSDIVKATGLTHTTVHRVLREADYLVDRKDGELYDHRDRQRKP